VLLSFYRFGNVCRSKSFNINASQLWYFVTLHNFFLCWLFSFVLRGSLLVYDASNRYCSDRPRGIFCLSWSGLCLSSPLPWYQTNCLGLGLAPLFWCLLVQSTPVELEAHELVTFRRFVVYLVHLAKKFSVLIVVGGRHYYCTLYCFYVSSIFVFLVIIFFQASGWVPGTRLVLFQAFTASAVLPQSLPRIEKNASTTSLVSCLEITKPNNLTI